MSSLFHKLKEAASGSSSTACSTSSCKKKDTGSELEVSLLVKILQNSGSKLRKDGSDKFFGMENFGNTCYCNSIVQALYHSVPFRENLINYPPLSVTNPSSGSIKSVPSIRAPVHHSVATGTSTKQKNSTTYDTIKKRAAINSGQTPSIIAQRPEDKPDSPEYKKRQALMTGPVLELTYENSSLYGMEESTYTGLKDIFMALIESKSQTGVLSPQRFLEIFKIENEMFRTSMHQDAHEFYGLVLNSIIANVEAKTKEIQASALVSIPASHQSAEPVSPATDALFPGEDNRSSGSGWVHEIFEGTLTSETKCLTCETVSQRDETFLDLSIDLDEHSSVTACLRKFSAEEMLCERNKFHCDNCGGLQEAERRTKIKRLPKILALHLKRFKYTEDMTQLQKLFHRVVYPYHLRMFNTTDDAEDPDRLYELYAVVVHIGGNAYHGHYVSVIKTQDRGWLLFDDEMVEPVDKHYARNFFGDKSGMACAYVLFYQETSAEAVRKEQELEGSYVPCHETEKMDPDLGCSVDCLSTSKSTGSSTPTQESRDGLLTDDFISVSIPSINDAPPSLTSSPTILNKLNTSSAFNQCTDGKNKKYHEKKEVKESERAQKAYNKAMAKERKFREKDSKKSSLAKKVPFFHIEDNKLDHREPSQSSVTESERNESTGITQSSSSTGRKYFTFLGGSKNGDERQLLMTSGRKLADKNETEGDEEYYSLDKYSKLAKDRFSFIPLGRKKSRLLRS